MLEKATATKNWSFMCNIFYCIGSTIFICNWFSRQQFEEEEEEKNPWMSFNFSTKSDKNEIIFPSPSQINGFLGNHDHDYYFFEIVADDFVKTLFVLWETFSIFFCELFDLTPRLDPSSLDKLEQGLQ